MIRSSYLKKVKKDYQRKNTPNPFFRRKPKEKKSKGYYRWILICAPLLLIFLTWLFFAAPFWSIQEVKVSGLTRLAPAEIEKIIWDSSNQRRGLIFSQRNIFLFDKKGAVKKIIDSYNFSGVQIIKKFPKTIEVKVNERPYAFLYQEGSALFYASADAYIIKEPAVKPEDKKKYFILESQNPASLIDEKNKINIKSDYLNFLFFLNSRLALHSDLPVEKYIIDAEFNTIKVKFVNGPQVFFNTKSEADSQIYYLLLVKNDKIKDNFSKTNYIDLRYGEKVYINPDFK